MAECDLYEEELDVLEGGMQDVNEGGIKQTVGKQRWLNQEIDGGHRMQNGTGIRYI